jgi:hypothetical protein
VAATAAPEPVRTDVPELDRVLCTIASQPEGWWSELPLRFRPTGAAFANVRRVPATLEMSAAGTGDGGRVAAEVDGFVVHGRVRAQDLVLRPARAMAVGVVVPKARAAIQWVGVDETRPKVSLQLDGPLTPVGNRPVVWTTQCADLSLGEQLFEARTATGLGEARSESYITALSPFTITSDPTGGSSLTVVATPGQHLVEVHGTEGGRRQILFHNPNSLLFGWIDSRVMRENMHLGGSGGGRGEGLRPPPAPESVRRRCPHAIDIVALIGRGGRDRGVVGVIRADTEFWAAASGTEHGHVDLVKLPKWLESVAGVRLAVPAADLETCPDAPMQKPQPGGAGTKLDHEK